MAYDNTNSGMLSKNERKQEDSHPDYTGVLNVDGVDYWLSAWIKTGKDGGKLAGKKFFSLAVQPKEKPAAKPEPRKDSGKPQDMDDDIPF